MLGMRFGKLGRRLGMRNGAVGGKGGNTGGGDWNGGDGRSERLSMLLDLWWAPSADAIVDVSDLRVERYSGEESPSGIPAEGAPETAQDERRRVLSLRRLLGVGRMMSLPKIAESVERGPPVDLGRITPDCSLPADANALEEPTLIRGRCGRTVGPVGVITARRASSTASACANSACDATIFLCGETSEACHGPSPTIGIELTTRSARIVIGVKCFAA